MLIETTVYGDLSLQWIREQHPDLAIVYLQSTDTVGHVFALFAPPRQAGVSTEDYARYSGVPEKFFHALDERIAEYRDAAAAAGGVLMLASDHGFLWGDGRPTRLSSVATASAAKWHAPYGMYLVWGNGIPKKPGHSAEGDVQQVAATLLALAGLPPGRDVNGDPLDGAIQTQAPRADYAASYRPAAAAVGVGKSAGDRDAVANLRSLGYIGASESDTAPPGSRGSTRTAGSFNNEGVILKDRGKLPQAIEAFEKALTVDPNLASSEWNLSDVLYAMGQNLDRSDALLIKAFADGMPDGGKFVVGRAMAYQRVGNAARSLKLMDSAVRANARDPELWLFRGRYRVENGDCRGRRPTSIARWRSHQAMPGRMRRAASRACAPAIAPARARRSSNRSSSTRSSRSFATTSNHWSGDGMKAHLQPLLAIAFASMLSASAGAQMTVKEHIEAMKHLRLGQENLPPKSGISPSASSRRRSRSSRRSRRRITASVRSTWRRNAIRSRSRLTSPAATRTMPASPATCRTICSPNGGSRTRSRRLRRSASFSIPVGQNR